MPDSSSGGSAGDSGTLGGEPLEWPSGGEEGGGLEDLDAQLDEALGDFDESMGQAGGAAEEEIDILNPMSSGSSSSSTDQPVFEDAGSEGESGESSMSENQGIAERASSGPSSSSSSSSGQQGGGGASGGESTSSGQDGGSSSSAGGGGGSAPTADRAETGSGQDEGGDVDVIPIPDDVGDGRDDDIVLKQIREAAMKEADPVLREKLWDEYRRIKGQR